MIIDGFNPFDPGEIAKIIENSTRFGGAALGLSDRTVLDLIGISACKVRTQGQLARPVIDLPLSTRGDGDQIFTPIFSFLITYGDIHLVFSNP